jgi:hypothetical protein
MFSTTEMSNDLVTPLDVPDSIEYKYAVGGTPPPRSLEATGFQFVETVKDASDIVGYASASVWPRGTICRPGGERGRAAFQGNRPGFF